MVFNMASVLTMVSTLTLLVSMIPNVFCSDTGSIWLSGDLHLHSNSSKDALDNPMNEILQVAKDRGLDFFVVTDHDNHFLGDVANHTWADPFYNSPIIGEDGHRLIYLYGVEWTTAWGHANFFSDQPWNHPELYALRGPETHNPHNGQQVAAKARELGLHFSPNHPNTSDPWELGYGIGIDSLEVWGNVWAIGNDRDTVNLWESLIDRGLRIPGRSGSDCHHQTGYEAQALNVGNPTNWVLAESRDGASILEGVRLGHVAMTYHPRGEWAELRADTGYNGMFETLMGDNAPLFPEQEVEFKVLLHNTLLFKNYTVQVFRNGQEWSAFPLYLESDNDPSEVMFSDTIVGQSRYRVELYGDTSDLSWTPLGPLAYQDVISLSNPIYFNFDDGLANPSITKCKV